MARKKDIYPNAEDVRKGKYTRAVVADEEPDFIGGAPNWDKFEAWDIDEILVWLNID